MGSSWAWHGTLSGGPSSLQAPTANFLQAPEAFFPLADVTRISDSVNSWVPPKGTKAGPCLCLLPHRPLPITICRL